MFNYLKKIFILTVYSLLLYGNEESLKNTYSGVLEVNKTLKSIGYYFLNDEYGEQLFAFNYKNNIFTVDKDGELYSYGEYSYSFSKDYFVIGVSGSPSGGHNRNLFLFKAEKNNVQLIGHISPEIGDIWEEYPEKDKNMWKLQDIDNDGILEYLVFSVESGYVYFEITEKGFIIDYNAKNYKELKGKITSKKAKATNDSFINGKINKKNIESIFELNQVDNFVIKKVT